MKAYYYAGEGDQRLAHQGDLVPFDKLASLGVLVWQLQDVAGGAEGRLAKVNEIAAERGYKNRDEITVSPTAMGDVYEDKVKMFFNEHLHEDEEIRYILDGEGFFDVRTKDDRWIRLAMEKGDLAVLPAGIYHRFTTAQTNYIKAMRLFKDEPKWTPLNRAPELDSNTARQEYLRSVS
ncbi:1,2-dihydroxy-3-keto-5-methylthiopentene dioxygenase [Savitreella phatthalungensis]